MMDWVIFLIGVIIGGTAGVSVIGIMLYNTVENLRDENSRLHLDLEYVKRYLK